MLPARLTKQIKKQQGFTLIELLVVIGILAVLLAITLIAINPARQFGNANNTKRRSDTLQILNAIGQYIAENKGTLHAGITNSVLEIGAGGGAGTQVDLCSLLVPTFLPALPTNPTLNSNDIAAPCPASYTTGYSVVKDVNNRVTVSADTADNGATISVTR